MVLDFTIVIGIERDGVIQINDNAVIRRGLVRYDDISSREISVKITLVGQVFVP